MSEAIDRETTKPPVTIEEIVADVARGIVKGNTTDALDIAAISLPHKIARVIGDVVGLSGGAEISGDAVFEAVTGIKPKGNAAEILGSMLSLGGVENAMIVGATRIGRNVEKASVLAREGASNAKIFNETGAYFGIEGKAKAAISDVNANITDSVKKMISPEDIYGLQRTPLNEVINHPELFAAYPELKNIDLISEMPGSGKMGAYFKARDEISINTSLPETGDNSFKSVLLHEIQHAIQYIDGFSPGGNTSQFLAFNPSSVQGKINAGRNVADKATRDAAERFKSKANEKIGEARNKYNNLPGEQEARFTQATAGKSDLELQQSILGILTRGSDPQRWDTVPIKWNDSHTADVTFKK